MSDEASGSIEYSLCSIKEGLAMACELSTQILISVNKIIQILEQGDEDNAS